MVDVEVLRLVTVSCANHSQYVAIALRNLFDSRCGTDFLLNWDGRSVKAHRTIVELFLEPRVLRPAVDQQRSHLVKQEVLDNDNGSDNSILDSLLEFMYKGEVTVPEEQLEWLLKAARELDFRVLVDSLVQASISNVSEVDNVLDIKVEDSINCVKDEATSSSYVQESQILHKNRFCQLGYGGPTPDCDPDPCCSNSKLLQSQEDVLKLEREGDLEEAHLSDAHSEDIVGDSLDDMMHPRMADGPDNYETAKDGTAKQYKCHQCDFDAASYKKYRYHLGAVHNVPPIDIPARVYKCMHCDLQTTKRSTYRSHHMSVHGKTSSGQPASLHECPECEYSSVFLSKLRRHVQTLHPGLQIFVVNPPLPQDDVIGEDHVTSDDPNNFEIVQTVYSGLDGAVDVIGEDPATTDDLGNLQMVETVYSELGEGAVVNLLQPPDCIIDDDAANLDDSFDRPMAHDPSIEIGEGRVSPRFNCQYCEFETSEVGKYRRHYLEIHGITVKGRPAQKYSCQHCEFETLTYLKYYRHVLRRHGLTVHGKPAPKHRCQHCDFETQTYTTYYRHLLTSHGLTVKGNPAPVYKCSYCRYKTLYKCNFNTHRSTHAQHVRGEAALRHKCPDCKHSFDRMSRLNRHIQLVHSNDGNA